MTYPEAITIPAPRHQTYPATIAEKFVDFHTKSPDVYDALVRLAREWVFHTRRNRLGIKALFERARWEFALRTSDPDFKLCNSYTAYYARLIMAREPDLVGLFELRRSEADGFMESDAWQELVTAGDEL